MRPETTRNFLNQGWGGWYTPFEKRRLKRYAAKRSRLAGRRLVSAFAA
jgi:hypothetical protein